MTKIAVPINCGKETCGCCNKLNFSKVRGFFCSTFSIPVTEKDGAFIRLPECKQAEVKSGSLHDE